VGVVVRTSALLCHIRDFFFYGFLQYFRACIMGIEQHWFLYRLFARFLRVGTLFAIVMLFIR